MRKRPCADYIIYLIPNRTNLAVPFHLFVGDSFPRNADDGRFLLTYNVSRFKNLHMTQKETHIMKRIALPLVVVLLLSLGLTLALAACAGSSITPDNVVASGQDAPPGATEAVISHAVLRDMQAMGWQGEFTATVEQIEGDYARLLLESVDPPGGFTAFARQEDGQWFLLLTGSAFRPDDLESAGVPRALFPENLVEWDNSEIVAAMQAHVAELAIPGQMTITIEAVEQGFARVSVSSEEPPIGFTGFLRRNSEFGRWEVISIGSGFNPTELQEKGVPEFILPEGWGYQ
jgi:hypothetical protein